MKGNTRFPKMLYAHRGASLRLPENTLEAFRNGLQSGANAIELDVRRTKDDVIVVFHDARGSRVADQPDLVKDVTYDEIRKWRLASKTALTFRVPTLSEVLEAFPNVTINVDIKDHDLKAVSLTVEAVIHAKAGSRVRLSSESFRVIRMIQALRYPGPIGMSGLEIAILYFLPKAMLNGFGWSERAAQVPIQKYFIRFDKTAFVEKCHALGIRVDFWVINDVETAKYVAALGADGIMSDDPGIVLSVFTI